MIINHSYSSSPTSEQPDSGRPRVALYLRSACVRQVALPAALAAQRDALVDLVGKHGLDLIGEDSDVAVSGRTLNRPGPVQLLQDADAEPHPFDIILVENLSRLDVTQVIELATKLATAGIGLISADAATPISPLHRNATPNWM